ncbi:MAG TPA: FHA domain-containing protein [Bacteroidales bacterium]|nr:FHA domain-containing protein [Bacteroidales bacterium]
MAKSTRILKTGMTVLKGGNVPSYTLEYITPSKRKKTGEYETIVIPYIEIGRANECNVQYANDIITVSRRHAAIERREDGYYIMQLSQTNPTLINGQAINKEKPLNNGDEIQLSIEGPKLRFNITASGTSNMGYTQKIGLMASQALKPYKIQIRVLVFTLMVAIVVGLYFINKQAKKNIDLQTQIAVTENRRVQDSIKYAQIMSQSEQVITKQADENSELKSTVLGVTNELDKIKRNIDTTPVIEYTKKEAYRDVKDYIYFLEVVEISVKFPNGDESNINNGWTGTAFLCKDGKLITARHCIQNWRYTGDESATLINYAELNGGSVNVKFRATSSKDQFIFSYDQVVIDDSQDLIFNGKTGKRRKEKKYILKYANDLRTDWAYLQTDKKSPLETDIDQSLTLEAGENLMIFGFTVNKENEAKNDIKPFFAESSVAQTGLSADGVYTLSAKNYEEANSGGPVILFNPELKTHILCVGIMAFGDFETRGGVSLTGGVVPIANIKDKDTQESSSLISQ